MFSLIVLVLITYIVSAVLGLIQISASRNAADSLYDFTMKPTRAVVIIGILVAGVFLAFIFLSYRANQFKGITAAIFILITILGILLILAPVKGFWETRVRDDDIYASRFWIVKKHMKLSEIDYCKYTKGGLHLYANGRSQISIDAVCNNLPTFEKRMEAEGIKVYYIGEDPEE